MGKHSIRGVTTGEELNVCGTGSFKRVGRHWIAGGEYTTVQEELLHPMHRTPKGFLAFVKVTYSIAPQGPNCKQYIDRAHPRPAPNMYMDNRTEWRRWETGFAQEIAHMNDLLAQEESLGFGRTNQGMLMSPDLNNVVTLRGRRKA